MRNTSPVSYEVNVQRLPRKGMAVVIDATAAERAELAAAHDLVSVESFQAELTVAAWKRNGVIVEGRVSAEIVQSCVVTLQPLEAKIDEPISAVFLPADSKLGRESFEVGGEIMIDFDGPDSPELFSGDRIDVGALAEEFFGLAIDPYPRGPGTGTPPEPALKEPLEGEGQLQQKLRKLFPDS